MMTDMMMMMGDNDSAGTADAADDVGNEHADKTRAFSLSMHCF